MVIQHHSAKEQNYVACARTHANTQNYDLLGYAFVPLSTGTFSRLGKPAAALLNKLAERTSASGAVFKDGFFVNALRELAFITDITTSGFN